MSEQLYVLCKFCGGTISMDASGSMVCDTCGNGFKPLNQQYGGLDTESIRNLTHDMKAGGYVKPS